MTKQELASYCVALVGIMESKEDAGIHRGKTLGREYDRAYAQLVETIRKEEEDEARNGEPQSVSAEARADWEVGKSRRG